jgi:hypothetical protein
MRRSGGTCGRNRDIASVAWLAVVTSARWRRNSRFVPGASGNPLGAPTVAAREARAKADGAAYLQALDAALALPPMVCPREFVAAAQEVLRVTTRRGLPGFGKFSVTDLLAPLGRENVTVVLRGPADQLALALDGKAPAVPEPASHALQDVIETVRGWTSRALDGLRDIAACSPRYRQGVALTAARVLLDYHLDAAAETGSHGSDLAMMHLEAVRAASAPAALTWTGPAQEREAEAPQNPVIDTPSVSD